MNPLLHVMHVLCVSLLAVPAPAVFILRYQCRASQSLAATGVHSFMFLHQSLHLKGIGEGSKAVSSGNAVYRTSTYFESLVRHRFKVY